MRCTTLAAGLLTVAMLAPAYAQQHGSSGTSATSTTSAASSSQRQSAGNQWRASKLIGLNVYNDQNEKIGDISEILLDHTGKVAGMVIGVGGFLGMGTRDIMVTPDKLKFVNEPVRTSSASGGTTGSSTNSTSSSASSSGSSARSDEHKWYPDHAVMAGATKDSLKAMPEFKY